ncbi:MAG: integral membrane sensor signal transduction histidine [Geobacteraceae bacterium]|nr:MAG: integral membrane sensor signal transduction histidine [Geobacteraceae bacterium]
MIHYVHIDGIQTTLSSAAILLAVVFSVYSLCRRDRSAITFILFAALSCTAALESFDLLAILYPERLLFWKKLALVAESCLPLAWLLFSLTYARQGELRSISLLQRIFLSLSLLFVVTALTFPIQSFYYSPDFNQERMLFLGDTGYVFYIATLVYLIVALINLEMTLANASHASRWKIKFEILGTGFLLSLLIFYYSQGLLYRTINMNLVPVRSVALLVAVVLTAYSQLRRGDGVKIYVSRNLFYKSVVMFAIGLYLIGLGLIGEGMKYFGESFQRSMVMAIAFVAGIGLLVGLLSETVKRKVKVFLYKNFYQNKYDYRNQWLQFTDRLSSSKTGGELLTSILSGYCETFGMGCGALFLNDNDRDGYYLAARLEIEPATTFFNRNDSVIEYMIERKWVVNVCEGIPATGTKMGEFFRINAVSFVIPLFLNDVMDGFIMLGKPLNRDETYNFEDYDLMKTFARQASSAILNLHLSDQLAQAREMEAIGRVSSFVIHDLKNLVYTVSLIVDNARDYIAEPEFQQDMLESLSNTVAKMKTLISRLKTLPEKNALQKESADLLQLVTDTAALVKGAEIRVTGSPVIAEVDQDELQKVALNLLLNAVDATGGEGPVTVEVGGGDQAFIRVRDEGCGISDDFLRRHLFTPFKTTKKKGMGIGLYQCKQIVEAHGGKIEVLSEVGKGAVFTVWVPFIQPSNIAGEGNGKTINS